LRRVNSLNLFFFCSAFVFGRDHSSHFGLAFVFHFSYFYQSIKSIASLVFFFTKLCHPYYELKGVINSQMSFNSFKVQFFSSDRLWDSVVIFLLAVFFAHADRRISSPIFVYVLCHNFFGWSLISHDLQVVCIRPMFPFHELGHCHFIGWRLLFFCLNLGVLFIYICLKECAIIDMKKYIQYIYN
jgi:hypothetical protein